MFETNVDKYQVCSFLGQGVTGSGKVFIAKHLPTSHLVALKKYDLEKIDTNFVKLIRDEIILMRQLNHQNLLPCLTAFVSGAVVHSVLPLMRYGSCRDLLDRHFPVGLPEAAVACILRSVLVALQYLHSRAIIHRAVRASHILIGSDGIVKLSGLKYYCPTVISGRWQHKVHSFPLSTSTNLKWLSPEVLQQNLEGYNEKCDVYSVGVTACELANGLIPFNEHPTTLMLIDKLRGTAPHLLDHTTFPHQVNDEDTSENGSVIYGEQDEYVAAISSRRFSEAFHRATECCLARDVKHRPLPAQLLALHFFKQAPHYSTLPTLLFPAVPVDSTVPSDYLDSLEVEEKLNHPELNPVDWDF